MINNVLYINKSGLNAMQNKLDNVADNIANSNTMGYKKKEISFRELLLNDINPNRELFTSGQEMALNRGVKSGIHNINFRQGPLIESMGTYNMAIEGSGFFGVRDGQGNLFLTRNGGFHIDSNGDILDDNGYYLDIENNPNMADDLFLDHDILLEEAEIENISINVDGFIRGEAVGLPLNSFPGEDIRRVQVEIGRIPLYNPENYNDLYAMGESRYYNVEGLNLNVSTINPEAFGNIRQNYLEGSNVELSRSMTEMIRAQRGFSLNSKAVQSTDDIMNVINNIKR